MTATRIASAATIGFGGVAALALASGSLLIDPAPTTVEGSAHSAQPSQVLLASLRPCRPLQHGERGVRDHLVFAVNHPD